MINMVYTNGTIFFTFCNSIQIWRFGLPLRSCRIDRSFSFCGEITDPAEHDGVAFEDLPDDWKCPRCKQSKEKFNKA